MKWRGVAESERAEPDPDIIIFFIKIALIYILAYFIEF